MPDQQLNEEDIKEKKRQRLLKAGYDARMRIKEEKEAELKKIEEIARQDEYERTHHHDRWLQKLRDDYKVGAFSSALQPLTKIPRSVLYVKKKRKE